MMNVPINKIIQQQLKHIHWSEDTKSSECKVLQLTNERFLVDPDVTYSKFCLHFPSFVFFYADIKLQNHTMSKLKCLELAPCKFQYFFATHYSET